jgi:hypothetical protein
MVIKVQTLAVPAERYVKVETLSVILLIGLVLAFSELRRSSRP